MRTAPSIPLFSASAIVAGLLLGTTACDQSKPPAPKPAAETPRAATETTPIKVPLGLPELEIPADNPMTEAKIELGRLLYFDTRLSKDGTISCATCHDPKMAWAEHKPTSGGINDQKGDRNAPTVINAAYMTSQFWDGRAATLEEQALGPIENPIEMGNEMTNVIQTVAGIEDYKTRFREVFGTEVTADGIARAIAAFERTVLSGNSPYDRFKAGDQNALNDAQKRGMSLFMDKAACVTCHSEPLFSNGRFYNAGVGSDKENPDPGRKKVTGADEDMGKFRVPHLRNVAETWPYFHDGSVEKLEDAVRFMAAGGRDNPNLSPSFKGMRDLKLSDAEIADLVAFVEALSGEYPVIEPPAMP